MIPQAQLLNRINPAVSQTRPSPQPVVGCVRLHGELIRGPMSVGERKCTFADVTALIMDSGGLSQAALFLAPAALCLLNEHALLFSNCVHKL